MVDVQYDDWVAPRGTFDRTTNTRKGRYSLSLEPQHASAYAFNTVTVHLEEYDVELSRRCKHALLTLAIVFSCSQLLFAHAVLMSSTPEKNSTVKGPQVEITLRYNVRIDGGRSRVQLVSPDGTTSDLKLDTQSKPDVLQCKISELKPGTYKIEWHVLASDGHISKGEVPFKVQ